jgi:hypothetical protein
LRACQDPTHQSGLPSWVPDWSTPPDPYPLLILEEPQDLYNASRKSTASLLDSQDKEELILTGFCVDEILKVGVMAELGGRVGGRVERDG